METMSNRREQKTSLLFIAIFILLSIANSCTQASPPAFPIPTQKIQTITASRTNFLTETLIPTFPFQSISRPLEGKFFFVELWVRIEGSGTLPSMRIDKPSYFFDRVSDQLNINSEKKYLPWKSTNWGLVGQGESLHGTIGGGASSNLTIVQQFPAKFEIPISTGKVNERNNVELIPIPVVFLGISVNGILSFEIHEKTIFLKPNETWSQVEEIIIFSDKYDGKIQVKSSITNYGWLDINSIRQ